MARNLAEDRRVTADDFFRMTDVGRAELVDGEVVPMSPVGFVHSTIAVSISANLRAFAKARGLGMVGVEAGFILGRDPDRVRAPDVAFVVAARVEAAEQAEGFVPFAPDLAIEVLSPNDTFYDVEAKAQEYIEAGTRLVWVVNPRSRHVLVYAPGAPVAVRNAADALDGGDVLPGLDMTVDALLS